MAPRKCSKCKYEYKEDEKQLNECPSCGGESLVVSFGSRLGLRDELSLKGLDPQKNVVSERQIKTDSNTKAMYSWDEGSPSSISIKRDSRVKGFEEESRYAAAFLTAFNALNHSSYNLEVKLKEDSEYADRVLISENDDPERIQIQIRHLDDRMVANLGREKSFKGTRTLEELSQTIKEAIKKKSFVDPNEKKNTVLLLIIPSPIGELRGSLSSMNFDFLGFKEVWIGPFREDAFPLQS